MFATRARERESEWVKKEGQGEKTIAKQNKRERECMLQKRGTEREKRARQDERGEWDAIEKVATG